MLRRLWRRTTMLRLVSRDAAARALPGIASWRHCASEELCKHSTTPRPACPVARDSCSRHFISGRLVFFKAWGYFASSMHCSVGAEEFHEAQRDSSCSFHDRGLAWNRCLCLCPQLRCLPCCRIMNTGPSTSVGRVVSLKKPVRLVPCDCLQTDCNTILSKVNKMNELKAQCRHLFKEWKAVNRSRDVLGAIRTFVAEQFEALRKSGFENDLANSMERELGALVSKQFRTLEDRRSKLEDELAEGGCPRGS